VDLALRYALKLPGVSLAVGRHGRGGRATRTSVAANIAPLSEGNWAPCWRAKGLLVGGRGRRSAAAVFWIDASKTMAGRRAAEQAAARYWARRGGGGRGMEDTADLAGGPAGPTFERLEVAGEDGWVRPATAWPETTLAGEDGGSWASPTRGEGFACPNRAGEGGTSRNS